MKHVLNLLFIIPFLGIGQEFKNEDYIYLKRHEYIKIDMANDRFEIAKEVTEQAEYLTAKKLYFANEIIGYDSFTEIRNIDAFTYLPHSDTRIKVDYIETQREFDNGIFYSDQEYKNFTFPAVSKGAITNLKYQEIIKDPHFLGLFRFGSFVPTKSGQLVVEFPKNVTIGYIDFNTNNVNIDFKQELTNNKHIYTWTVNNLVGFQSEDDAEEPLHYIPHIIIYIKSYEVDGKSINVLNNTADLYKWYVTLVDQIDNSELKEVHEIAEDLIVDLSDKRTQAQAIFNWVQNNITYVAFEDGLGGFIPRSAASVCSKRYGDCKDMANLLYEMLNHVGIEAYRAWIGTRNRPYSYHDVPTPMVDNHMITATVIENDTIFLDATDSYVPFGMPSAFTQTKEALLGINETTYKIVRVPEQDSHKSILNVHTSMTLEGELLKVKEQRKMTGYSKVDFISDYTYKKDDKTEEEYLNTKLSLGNNKTQYINITKENFDNTANSLVLNYDLIIDNYAKSVGNKAFINLNIDKTLSKSKIDIPSRKYSKKIDNKHEKHYVTEFIIPNEYVAEDIPETMSFDNEKFGYKISYKLEGSTIIQEKFIYIKTLKVERDEFELWNDFIKSLTNAYRKSITLEKKT